MENTKEELIKNLLDQQGISTDNFEGVLISEMIDNCLRLYKEEHNTAQLKLMNRSLKEMRYAYRIFNQYSEGKRLSIFGSARTPEDHTDYITAKEFSAEMAKKGWMCITGAANGIMKAGLEGNSRESSFGLSIRLAFEPGPSPVLEGDPKLINFRYFFTRKLMFVSHSDAVAVFPGGVGTMDELFELLTLMQTGKSNIIPVILLESDEGVYWRYWEIYLKKNLLANGWISHEDVHFYHIANSIEDAVEYIERFYHRYHSARYVRDTYVIRMKTPLKEEQLEMLNQDFKSILKSGSFKQTGALPEEDDHLDLPRLVFHFTRRDFGILRMLIDRINVI